MDDAARLYLSREDLLGSLARRTVLRLELTGDADADTAELKRRMQLLLDASRAQYADLFDDGQGEPWMPVVLGGTAPTLEEADAIYARERAEREAKKAAKAARKRRK